MDTATQTVLLQGAQDSYDRIKAVSIFGITSASRRQRRGLLESVVVVTFSMTVRLVVGLSGAAARLMCVHRVLALLHS